MIPLVNVTGEAARSNAADLERALDQASRRAQDYEWELVVDLASCTFIDEDAILTILAAASDLHRGRRGRIRVRGAAGQVSDKIALFGLERAPALKVD